MPSRTNLPQLPKLLAQKIYKTGQTRGSDDDVIYQNRVGRNSTVLIPYQFWQQCRPYNDVTYENGYIVLISPYEYFHMSSAESQLSADGLALGDNALVFYETRDQWITHNPDFYKWTFATRRISPLGGQYVARVPATTAIDNGEKINLGFTNTRHKGAGIRVYEYATKKTIDQCRIQLEALFWKCRDSVTVAEENGMTNQEIETRMQAILEKCLEDDLLDITRLIRSRILNSDGYSICPLCLEELSGRGFFNRMEQAEGREVPDLTITQINLFHIEELRLGVLNHRPYNLGWGHHHCNVVVKDSGIMKTLEWMRRVVDKNICDGYLSTD